MGVCGQERQIGGSSEHGSKATNSLIGVEFMTIRASVETQNFLVTLCHFIRISD
jgi:hypothetical protein